MRRHVFAGSVLAAFVLATGSVSTQRPATTVQVYKSPTCGCCANWVKHLQQHGFRTQVTETDNVADIKAQHKIPARAQSCHTAIVDGYVIEGHVPATDVQRLLKERPAIKGISLPGMPDGAPGMTGRKTEPFTIYELSVGQPKVYAVE